MIKSNVCGILNLSKSQQTNDANKTAKTVKLQYCSRYYYEVI